MSKTVRDLYEVASMLDEKQRAELAGLLLESLELEPDAEAAWTAAIAERATQIDEGHVELIPWENVKREMYRRISIPR